MAFSFPTSPTLNQQYTFGTKTWRYNGTGWVLVTGVDAAQSAWSTANLAYVNSNAATVLAQGAFDTANSKFDKVGGTISGNVFIAKDLSVGGNVTILGNTFTVNAGSIVANDTILIMGKGNYLSDALDIGFVSHYNDGTNAHTGFIRDAGTKEWQLFKGYTPEIAANNNININDPSFLIDTLNANLHSTTVLIKRIDILPYANGIYDKTNASFIHANSGFNHANAGFDFANTLAGGLNTVNVSISVANDHANAAFNHANSAYQSQNATGQYANSGFIHANAAFNAANNALDTWVRGQANAAFTAANSAGVYGNSAYIHANAAFNAANNALDTWVRGQANAAFIQANSGFIHANAAFDFANTLSGGAAIDNVARITANAGFIKSNSAFDHANAAFIAANSSPGSIGNAAYIHANSAFFHANAAFIRANNSLDANNGGSVTGTVGVTGNVYAGNVIANSGFTSTGGTTKLELTDIGVVAISVAGQSFGFGASGIESSPGIYGGSYGGNRLSLSNETNLMAIRYDVVKIQTGTDGSIQNEWVFSNNSLTAPGGITANGFTAGGINVVPTLSASYVRANNSLDANNGGTVTGDVRITGNLTVSGNTTYVNTSQVLIGDNIITLNAAINQASAPMVDAGIEVDRGNAANVYMLWNETEDRWTFTNDGVGYEGVGYASTAPYANAAFVVANAASLQANAAFSAQNTTASYANSAFIQANASFTVANGAFIHANASFNHANAAYQSQNATGNYANSAFSTANSAGVYANGAFDSANSAGVYANSAFTAANSAGVYANASFIVANAGILQANAAFVVANAATLQANAAFFHANAAYESQNTTGQYANAAFIAANSAGQYANAAFIQANIGYDLANSIANNSTVAGTANVAKYVEVTPRSDAKNYNVALVDATTGNLIIGANTGLTYHPTLRTLSAYVGQFASSVTTTSLLPAATIITVFNTTATTIRMGGAATTINIGNVGGTTNVFGTLAVNGVSVIGFTQGAYNTGNSAFIRANNSLDANVGGTITGNVVVIGNVVATAFETSGPSGDITGANAIFASYVFGANGTIDILNRANAAFANANAGLTKANSAYNHANAAFDYANTATGAVVTYGIEPPASGNSNGHIWIDSSDGTEYTYFKDVDGFQWVEFGPTSSNVSMNTYITADISSSYAHANAAYNQANTANSTITSNRLSSNLAINIIRVLETANIYSTAVSGNVNIDIGNNTTYFFSSNTTGNVTFNLRANGNAGGIYDSLVNIGQTSTVAIALKQGSTRYKANLCIDGLLQTVYWLGNSAPDYATTQEQAIDVYSFVVFKTAANTYSVLAANSNFGLAQGQPGQG